MGKNLKNGRSLTLDEVSKRLWESEGRIGSPLKKQSIQKIEQRAITKMKLGLLKQGFGEDEIGMYLDSLGKQIEMRCEQ